MGGLLGQAPSLRHKDNAKQRITPLRTLDGTPKRIEADMLLPFLIVGTGAGAILAAVAFSISAISIPMLVDRYVSAM